MRIGPLPEERAGLLSSGSENTEKRGSEMNTLTRPDTAPALYAQDGLGYEAVVHAHYFIGGCDWLVTEYDGEDIAFGWTCLNGDRQNAELGYVSMTELASIAVPLRVIKEGHEATVLTIPGINQTVEYDEDWPAGLTLRQGIAVLDERQGR